VLQSIKNCQQNIHSTSHEQELDDVRIQIYKGQAPGRGHYLPHSQTCGFTKTTPGKAEKPFSNFTEHFIAECKFSLEQNEKAEAYPINSVTLHYFHYLRLLLSESGSTNTH